MAIGKNSSDKLAGAGTSRNPIPLTVITLPPPTPPWFTEMASTLRLYWNGVDDTANPMPEKRAFTG